MPGNIPTVGVHISVLPCNHYCGSSEYRVVQLGPDILSFLAVIFPKHSLARLFLNISRLQRCPVQLQTKVYSHWSAVWKLLYNSEEQWWEMKGTNINIEVVTTNKHPTIVLGNSALVSYFYLFEIFCFVFHCSFQTPKLRQQ